MLDNKDENELSMEEKGKHHETSIHNLRIPAMRLKTLVSTDEFWASLQEDIRSSKGSIFIQTLSFEGDRVGKMLSDRLFSSAAADVRVLVDSYTKFVISDKFRHSPKNLLNTALHHEARETFHMLRKMDNGRIQVRFTNSVGSFLLRFLARNHKKLIVIDGKIAYIGGINFSEHNFDWHDMAIRIEDNDIAGFLSRDFLSTWHGQNLNASQRFEGIEFLTFDGSSNEVTFEPVLELMTTAKERIYIESPYVSFPFCEKLREARRRGVEVTVITPEVNNWGFMDGYLQWEAVRSAIELRFYRRMTHLKAMLIDEKFLVVGSSNFDYLSYRLHQEIIAVITDREVISDFQERVIREDLKHSRRFESGVSFMRGLRVQLGLMFLKTVVACLKRI
jgi:cardiolipin synthase